MLLIPWSLPVDHLLPSSGPKVLFDSPWNRVRSLVNTGQCWQKQEEEYFIAKLPAITWMFMVLKVSVWAQNLVYITPGPRQCVSALGLIAHNGNLNTSSYWELPRDMGAGTVSPLFILGPWYLLSDHLGPTCTLNGCVPYPVHPHKGEEETALACFSQQLLTGERWEGRGSLGHKILTSTLPVKAVSGAHLSVPLVVFRTAWSQDKPSFLWQNPTATHASHIKASLLSGQQIASSLLTNHSQQLQGALYVQMLLPDILSQYTNSLPPLLPWSLPISKNCHTAKH